MAEFASLDDVNLSFLRRLDVDPAIVAHADHLIENVYNVECGYCTKERRDR